mmetsp:Transcript_45433/g.75246  ORF Transcript_45433/g.75246 Transcript_45433/m.75246 type:complete len:208 (+) Transcript_45433:743-1366(+)
MSVSASIPLVNTSRSFVLRAFWTLVLNCVEAKSNSCCASSLASLPSSEFNLSRHPCQPAPLLSLKSSCVCSKNSLRCVAFSNSALNSLALSVICLVLSESRPNPFSSANFFIVSLMLSNVTVSPPPPSPNNPLRSAPSRASARLARSLVSDSFDRSNPPLSLQSNESPLMSLKISRRPESLPSSKLFNRPIKSPDAILLRRTAALSP